MNHVTTRALLTLLSFTIFITCFVFSQTNIFDYKRSLFGTPATINLSIVSLNASSGSVTVNGGDSQAPTSPFTWSWGDGNVTSGFFPQSHTYTNPAKNYILTVVAHYNGGQQDSAKTVIRFVAPSVSPVPLAPEIAVRIPTTSTPLATRLYSPPVLSTFDDRFFSTIPRSTLEYILSVVATIEKDFSNDDVFLFNSKFEQVMLRDSSFLGAYSLWFTNPVAFGVGDVFLKGSIGYGALFHEMGHNFSLNAPAPFYFGGRIDGNANAIFSETMAQIYADAAGYEIINHYQAYGLSADLMWDIQQDMNSSMSGTRSTYTNYMNSGKRFASWNDPGTPLDETFNTFGTIAYEFCKEAENTGQGYRTPLKRMMKLLQGFNASWMQRYDQLHNTAAADTFRATLMVAAISYGFAKDLRSDFRSLSFPISDQIYNELYKSVATAADNHQPMPTTCQLLQNYPNPFNPGTTINFQVPTMSHVTLKVIDLLGREVATLVEGLRQPGSYTVRWDGGALASGLYFSVLQAGDFLEIKKMMLIK